MKKKIFAPLLGAVVLGLSAYAGYRMYDAYAGNSEDDLLLANAEALADDESTLKCDNVNGYKSWATRFIFGRKREFYDCCYILREGYDPEGICVR